MLQGLLVDLIPLPPAHSVEKLHEWWNNESRDWAHMGGAEPVSRAQTARSIADHGDQRQTRTRIDFAMQAKDGNLIGSMSLKHFNDASRWAWVGAWIGEKDYWGGGHGTDALLLIVEYAFDWLDLRRLVLKTMNINARARRNVEKVGFKLEWRAREAVHFQGQIADAVMYGLLRDEWVGREALVAELDLRNRAAARYGEAAERKSSDA